MFSAFPPFYCWGGLDLWEGAFARDANVEFLPKPPGALGQHGVRYELHLRQYSVLHVSGRDPYAAEFTILDCGGDQEKRCNRSAPARNAILTFCQPSYRDPRGSDAPIEGDRRCVKIECRAHPLTSRVKMRS